MPRHEYRPASAALIALLGGVTALLSGCSRPSAQASPAETASASQEAAPASNESEADGLETATFGAGCFWCVEAVFQEVAGVKSVVSGYSGGHVANPTYEQVCSKTTGHAEVCRIEFDPREVSYKHLLEVFWKTHDPTTPNRQGADEGPQYRSVVFYHSEKQRELAEFYKQELDKSGAFGAKIVTEIARAPVFYPAEDYHQNYFRSNPNQGYCQFVIQPKLEKYRKAFKK